MNTTESNARGIKEGWPAVGAIFAFWLAVIPMDLSKDIVKAVSDGAAIDFPLLREPVLWWSCWLIITPLLARLAERIRPGRIGWPRTIVTHAVVALITVCVTNAAAATLFLATGTMWQSTWTQFYLALLDNVFVPSYALYLGAIGSYFLQDHFRRLLAARLGYLEARERAEILERIAGESHLDRIARNLHPSFLRRALQAVSSTIEQERPGDAIDTITSLGDLLRATLAPRSIPLEREFDLFEQYIAIGMIAGNRRLRSYRAIEGEAGGSLVPPLLLQPLAERLLLSVGDATDREVALRISARMHGDCTLIGVRIGDDVDLTPEIDLGEEVRASAGHQNLIRILDARWSGQAGYIRLGPVG